MSRFGSGAFCLVKNLAYRSFRNNYTYPGLGVYARKKSTQGNISCLTHLSAWTKSANVMSKFYSKDSKRSPGPTAKLVADKKTKQFKVIEEKPIKLSSEQLISLFYSKIPKEQPIPLTAQDKYFKAPAEEIKESPPIENEQFITTKGPPKDEDDVIDITSKSLGALKSSEIQTVEMDDKKEVILSINSNVINSVMEKELGEETKRFQENIIDEQRAMKSWKTIKYVFFIVGTMVVGAIVSLVMYIGKPLMDGDTVIPDKYAGLPVVLQYLYRSVDEFNNFNKLIKDPSRDKLLPDVVKPPYYQAPYTLVLEFTDVLVHPEWTYSTGWRFKKRPGLDQFLEALYARFEVVVYTAELGMTVFPIIEAIDKNNLISYKLVRDATKFMDGHHVKDLDKLNRDLSKVVVIDWNPESTKLHTDNLFRMPRWKGNDDDTALYDLTALLIAISEWKVEDVRSVLKYYSEFDDPLESFKERQKLLAAQDL